MKEVEKMKKFLQRFLKDEELRACINTVLLMSVLLVFVLFMMWLGN